MNKSKPGDSEGLQGERSVTGVQAFYQLPRREVILTTAGVMLAMFLGAIDQTVVSTAMPRIIADLGGLDRYTWVTTAYLVAATATMPIVGRLTDMYGRKWFYVAGLVIFLLGSVLSAVSATLTQLIIFRAFQGVGGGIMMANAFIVIGDLFPPAERGKYQGMITAVFGLSSIVGPTLGGFITDNLSWHWIFYINLPLGIPVIVLFVRFFPYIRPTGLKQRVDLMGLTCLVLCIVPLMLGLSWGGAQYEWDSPEVIGALAMGLLMAIVFVMVESRASEPIMPLGLFRDRIVGLCMPIMFFTGFGMLGGLIFIPLYFQGVLGSSATASGSFLTPMMLGVVAGSLVSGQAVARLGGHYRYQALLGLGIMATGIFLLSRMTVDTTYGRAVFNIVLTGLGLGTALPLFTIVVQNAVPYRIMGVATSSMQFFRQIGGTLGLAVLGSLMANRFATAMGTVVPAAVKEALPPDGLSQLTSDPQALVSPDAATKLEQMFDQFGQEGAGLVEQLIHSMREALAAALSDVFFLSFVAVLVAFVLTLFLKEIPLRSTYQFEDATESEYSETLTEEANP
ncbi:MAG: MFS transporter [Chloroflexi bacterium]|nr:MFS transporter [Chloroflexota bacterium]